MFLLLIGLNQILYLCSPASPQAISYHHMSVIFFTVLTCKTLEEKNILLLSVQVFLTAKSGFYMQKELFTVTWNINLNSFR